MIKKVLKWCPSLFIAACNFYLSSREHIEHMPSFWNADKVVHFFCFAAFSFWTAFACNVKTFRQTWFPTLIISAWAVTDEIHQSFVPGRSASVLDWVADTIGAFAGAVIFVFLLTKILRWRSETKQIKS